MEYRMKHWERSKAIFDRRYPAHKTGLAKILQMDLDTDFQVLIVGEDWPLMKQMAKALGITPRDWLLASAWYNAQLEMERRAIV